MNQEEKAQFYNFLLSEHTKLSNRIQQIKAENVNLDSNQERRIQELQYKQNIIMKEVERLMTS